MVYAEVVPLRKTGKIEVFTYKIPQNFIKKAKRGAIVEIPFGKKNSLGVILEIQKIPPQFETKEIKNIISSFFLKKWQIDLALWISKEYIASLGKTFSLFLPPTFKYKKIKIKNFNSKSQIIENKKNNLTKNQKEAILKITGSKLTLFGGQNFLLETPFVEEKWQIYLELIKQTIKKEGQILLLFPEKSYLEKAEKIFKKQKIPFVYFGGDLDKRKKTEIFNLVQNQKTLVILGLKSALFLPFGNLKTIVVDEEENESYQEEREPQYFVPHLAIKLGEVLKSTVIIQSSQPSIFSYWNFLEGKLIPIKVIRKSNYKIPSIKILDLRKEKNRQFKIINTRIKKIIEKAIQNNKKILFYLDRKGYSWLKCNQCGYIFQCLDCKKNLIFKNKNLYCSLCQKKFLIPQNCPNCKSLFISEISFGIEKLIKEIKENFPDIIFEKIDSSEIKNKKDILKKQKEIKRKKPQIIVATKLIFSLKNIPKFDILFFVMPEINFNLNDFKIEEKTLFRLKETIFGLLERKKGLVIIPTHIPDHPIFESLINYKNEFFYNFILEQRKKLFLPPYSSFIKISYLNKSSKKAIEQIENIKRKIEKISKNNGIDVSLSGPFVDFSGKIKKWKFFSLIIKVSKKDIDKIAPIIKNLNSNWKKEIENF